MTSTRARGVSSRSNSTGDKDIQERITALDINTFTLCSAKQNLALLFLCRERALPQVPEIDRALHRVLLHRPGVDDLERIPFHRRLEAERDGVAFDGSGHGLIAEHLRGIGAGQVFAVLLEG